MLAFKHNAGGYVTPGTLASNVETSGGTNITAHRYSVGALIVNLTTSEASGTHEVFEGTSTINWGGNATDNVDNLRSSGDIWISPAMMRRFSQLAACASASCSRST